MLDALKKDYYPYPSRRNVVYGSHGMVATSQPLAAGVGLDILKRGGNAIDAAIAMAVTLTVVEPTGNGIGGDAFALIWKDGKLHGLNASGPSPAKLSAQALAQRGLETIPGMGVVPVTVPGAPAGWAAAWKRFGRLAYGDLFEAAIEIADRGFNVQAQSARIWKTYFETHRQVLTEEAPFAEWMKTFTLEGKIPKAGQLVRLPHHARTLQAIAESESESFYRGDIAEKIASFMAANQGFLDLQDLAAYQASWVQPISVNYGGFDVHEIPPNGHGITVLMALNILKQLDGYQEAPVDRKTHYQIEALKLAFSDAKAHVSDPRSMRYSNQALLSDDYARERSRLIEDKARQPLPGSPDNGGTVYLAAADQEGNMVSFIQSNYMEFGSGLVIPGTGIAMHNRGLNFSMDEASANYVGGSKYPYHTIIPGFLTRGGEAVGPFGVMGGFMQPQGHFQVLLNTIEDHLNPQSALDKPRWQWVGDKKVEVEHAFDQALAMDLLDRGHDIKVKADSSAFGRGQIIWRDQDGLLCGGCEPRTDSAIGVC